MNQANRETGCSMSPEDVYRSVYAEDAEWCETLRQRLTIIENGTLGAKVRELIFVVGYFLNGYGEAARYHKARALAVGASEDDLRLILKILDFYRGLRGFQDAQMLLALWRSGVFPQIKPPHTGSTDEIFHQIVDSRKYIANGFRVYSADGEWLRLYLRRSDAIKTSAKTIDERIVQLLSMAITLKNHGYSDNWNDGCIEVHEAKTRSLGTTDAEIVEVVQIMELCDSMTTAWQGRNLLDLG
jgi:alkylhydroperoxidase/carboxymuconolactone decarboxylase family protein YurZ